jgi:hypothetical protein
MSNTGQDANKNYEPNFVLQSEVDEERRHQEEARETEWRKTHLGAVTEQNWTEYAAKGFRIIKDLSLEGDEEQDDINLRVARLDYGDENVYTGDAFDEDAAMPLRYKPGKTIYITPEGEEHYKRVLEEQHKSE